MKYFISVIGQHKSGGSLQTDMYYTTKKKLDTEEMIEEMRTKAKEAVKDLDQSKGLVITNIFGPLRK